MRPSTIFYVLFVPSIYAAWQANTAVTSAGLGAVGIACGIGATLPPCAITFVGFVFATIFSAIFNENNQGDSAGDQGDLDEGAPNTGTKRHASTSVVHYLPNGNVYSGLNTSALEFGVWHAVHVGGSTLYASKHPNGNNIIRGDFAANGLVERDTDENAIDTVEAQFGDVSVPTKDTWSDDDTKNLANTILSAEDLTARQLCSTIHTDNDADTFDVSWVFGTPNQPIPDTLPPACGA